ncbi:hypothetical protein GGX14DRAFT_678744 [Mycena pura]|uniref:GATA-type domain-containing protein n=1 Tax=Mycena pura TaxID=153505 RepID=A0AAD6UTU1_9AGAR|nr:hypothetical protein GGX14DRAFT_678744 [Mycena pura]
MCDQVAQLQFKVNRRVGWRMHMPSGTRALAGKMVCGMKMACGMKTAIGYGGTKSFNERVTKSSRLSESEQGPDARGQDGYPRPRGSKISTRACASACLGWNGRHDNGCAMGERAEWSLRRAGAELRARETPGAGGPGAGGGDGIRGGRITASRIGSGRWAGAWRAASPAAMGAAAALAAGSRVQKQAKDSERTDVRRTLPAGEPGSTAAAPTSPAALGPLRATASDVARWRRAGRRRRRARRRASDGPGDRRCAGSWPPETGTSSRLARYEATRASDSSFNARVLHSSSSQRRRRLLPAMEFAPADYDHDKLPRTPSPADPSDQPHHHQNYKPDLDPVHIFSSQDADDREQYPQWPHSAHAPFSAPGPSAAARPSLLQELYDSDGLSPEHASPPDMYVDSDWPPAPAQPPRAQDYTPMRRATLPYTRQERPDTLAGYPPFLPPHAHAHAHAQHAQPHHPHEYDALPLSAEPAALHAHAHDQGYSPPGYPPDYDGADPAVKLEDGPHHHPMHYSGGFYRPVHMQQHPHQHLHPHPHQLPHQHPHHMQHHPHAMHPHALHSHHGYPSHGIAVQHTDDAASKETQYLRRRCFNCHTTEPPSWRRSTLNPGKIVCNKCGLYERTHLRPRPLRFDELRAGNKARKGGAGKGSPKAAAAAPGGVKKGGIVRRSSVSSTGSSTQSGSGASDWDDNVSVYSGASTPASGPPSSASAFSSPHPPSLSLSSSVTGSPGARSGRDSLSQSPPRHASPNSSNSPGIRLPHAPEIPTLSNGGLRTKPRSNTTGGVGMGGGMYYHQQHHQPPPFGQQQYQHPQHLHHSSSSSSLHAGHGELTQSPPMMQSSLSPAMHPAEAGGELYRRGSMPEMHGGWDDGSMGMSGMGMGMGIVKEEPRAVLV